MHLLLPIHIAAGGLAVVPEPFTSGQMRALPFLLLFGAMSYWLWRVRSRRTLPVLVRHDSTKENIQ